MWASAIVAVSIGVHRGHGGGNAVNLNVNLFACAAGFLSGCILLFVVQLATRPFDTPWLSPSYFDEFAAGGVLFDDRTSHFTLGTGSTRMLDELAGSRSKKHTKSPSTTSMSRSSSRSRAKKMSQTRRYILEALTPVPLSPLKLPSPGATGQSANLEDNLVPGVSRSESYFAARTDTPQDKRAPSVAESALSPDTVFLVSPSMPPRPIRIAEVRRVPLRARRRSTGTVSVSRTRKNDVQPVPPDRGPEPAPPPAPPPTPPQAYIVPGAWLPQLGPEQEIVGCA